MPINLNKKSSKKSGQCLLTISEDMTIYNAAKIHQELIGYFADYSSFEVDLSAVEEIDCSGIQLLLALKYGAENESKSLILSSVSDSAAEVMELLNIKDQFNYSTNHKTPS